MSRVVPERELPVELGPFAAVEAAYPAELARCHEALRRGLPVLVECDKELAPYFYKVLRDRLKAEGRRCVYLDGRPDAGAAATAGLVATLLLQLRDAVRGAVDDRVVVLPHLDLLTTSAGGLSTEAREVIPLLYENPAILWLGFKDPSFPLPRVIESLFPRRESILGVARERLRHLVTQREARKLGPGPGLDPYLLYKHVSGQHAVRLRRLLGALEGEDHPRSADAAVAELRAGTLAGGLVVPSVDLEADIGGYARVKARLREDILEVLARRDAAPDADEMRRVEQLLPRGIILWGPPGTGKTLFAKAIASSLGAAVTVVSGPELKSKWVGESEENVRQLFRRARQAAPSVIVFDELDSFASRRRDDAGGAGHSMVNQLLTEMDGFRKEELVFVVGTTNLLESLDPALRRPGRFELELHVPAPSDEDRREILAIHDRRFGLALSPRALEHAVRRTGGLTGDHLMAMCRGIARRRLRAGERGPTELGAVEAELAREPLDVEEARLRATHEAGHAICALACGLRVPWLALGGDLGAELAASLRGRVATRGRVRDVACALHGGRAAEELLCGEPSTLSDAGWLAELGDPDEQKRARRMLEERRPALERLRDRLLAERALDEEALGSWRT